MLQVRTSSATTALGRMLALAKGRSRLRRYGAAAILPLAALIVTSGATQISHAPFFPLFTLAIVLSSVFGGMWPGLFSLAESVIINLIVAQPSLNLRVTSLEDVTRIAFFAVAGCAIAVVIGTAGDLQSQIQIQHSELFILLRSIGDAVIATDNEGKVSFMNPAAELATRWTLADAQGRAIEQVFRIVNEHTRDVVNNPIREVLNTGRIVGLANHTVLIRKDGTEIPIDDSAAPVKDSRERILGAVLVFRDITRARLNEAAMRRADRFAVAGKLASTIAHEVNNPLEAVANLIYLATQDETLSPTTRRHLDQAESELRRAIESCRRTLSFRRVGQNRTQVSVRDLVDSVLDLYRNAAMTRQVEIRNEIASDSTVTIVPTEIRQLVNNLISNAIDAMPRGGILRITTTGNDDGSTISLTVSDTGSGIEPRNLERIFEPFFTTKDKVGTGLGLWVAKRIAEEHQGDLLVESCDKGTTFTLVLPAVHDVVAVSNAT